MDLLQRLEAVEIDHTSRISHEDEEFCLNEQKSYEVAWKAIKQAYKSVKTLMLVESIKDKYIHKYGVVSEIEKALKDCNSRFTSEIKAYFSNKYNVEFNSLSIVDNFTPEQFITFEEVLDHLFEQLGGFTFAELANQQIKNKINEAVYKFEVKKHTLHLPDFLYFENWFGFSLSYRSDEKLKKLCAALMLFENGMPSSSYEMDQIKYELNKGSNKHTIFDKYSFDNFSKIKSFKTYKNGKVSIEFHSMDLANEFANTYLKK